MLFWFSFYTFFFFACLLLRLLCGRCHMARHNLRHGCLLFVDGCTTANQSHIYLYDDAKYVAACNTLGSQTRHYQRRRQPATCAGPWVRLTATRDKIRGLRGKKKMENKSFSEPVGDASQAWRNDAEPCGKSQVQHIKRCSSRKRKKRTYKFWGRHSVVKCTMNAYIMYNIYNNQ